MTPQPDPIESLCKNERIKELLDLDKHIEHLEACLFEQEKENVKLQERVRKLRENNAYTVYAVDYPKLENENERLKAKIAALVGAGDEMMHYMPGFNAVEAWKKAKAL